MEAYVMFPLFTDTACVCMSAPWSKCTRGVLSLSVCPSSSHSFSSPASPSALFLSLSLSARAPSLPTPPARASHVSPPFRRRALSPQRTVFARESKRDRVREKESVCERGGGFFIFLSPPACGSRALCARSPAGRVQRADPLSPLARAAREHAPC